MTYCRTEYLLTAHGHKWTVYVKEKVSSLIYKGSPLIAHWFEDFIWDAGNLADFVVLASILCTAVYETQVYSGSMRIYLLLDTFLAYSIIFCLWYSFPRIFVFANFLFAELTKNMSWTWKWREETESFIRKLKLYGFHFCLLEAVKKLIIVAVESFALARIDEI